MEKEKGKFAVKIVDVFLRYLPIAKQKVFYDNEVWRVVVEKPIGVLAWRVILAILVFGEKEREVYRVPAEKFYAFIRTTNKQAIRKALYELVQCEYVAENKKEEGMNYYVRFLIEPELREKNGMLTFKVHESFGKLKEDGLWFYFPFVYFLRSQASLNLHAFLSANSSLRKARESTLIRRAELNNVKMSNRRIALKQALDELVRVGFLEGYEVQGKGEERIYILQRPDSSVLKARALERLSRFYEVVEVLKEKQKQRQKESMRRRRELEKRVKEWEEVGEF